MIATRPVGSFRSRLPASIRKGGWARTKTRGKRRANRLARHTFALQLRQAVSRGEEPVLTLSPSQRWTDWDFS